MMTFVKLQTAALSLIHYISFLGIFVFVSIISNPKILICIVDIPITNFQPHNTFRIQKLKLLLALHNRTALNSPFFIHAFIN